MNVATSISFHDMSGLCAILAVGVCLALILLLVEIKLKNAVLNCCSKRGSIPRKVCSHWLFMLGRKPCLSVHDAGMLGRSRGWRNVSIEHRILIAKGL